MYFSGAYLNEANDVDFILSFGGIALLLLKAIRSARDGLV
jgi:hypothetical protein